MEHWFSEKSVLEITDYLFFLSERNDGNFSYYLLHFPVSSLSAAENNCGKSNHKCKRRLIELVCWSWKTCYHYSTVTPTVLLRQMRPSAFEKPWGTFHSMENSGLNVRKFLVTNGTAFSGISGKRDNLAWYSQIFGRYGNCRLTWFSFEIFGWMVGSSEIQQFSYFLKSSQGISVTLDLSRFEMT